jgi:hypothetical protein
MKSGVQRGKGIFRGIIRRGGGEPCELGCSRRLHPAGVRMLPLLLSDLSLGHVGRVHHREPALSRSLRGLRQNDCAAKTVRVAFNSSGTGAEVLGYAREPSFTHAVECRVADHPSALFMDGQAPDTRDCAGASSAWLTLRICDAAGLAQSPRTETQETPAASASTLGGKDTPARRS